MQKKIYNILLILILILLTLSLISAFIIEHILNHKPCNLCVYQRVPYIISILFILLILIFKKNNNIILFLLFVTFLISSILAFYHFGIEQGFFKESFLCENTKISDSLNKEEILKQLKQINVSCKNVTFRVFGLSLATINTFFSIVLSVIFYKLLRVNYEKNR